MELLNRLTCNRVKNLSDCNAQRETVLCTRGVMEKDFKVYLSVLSALKLIFPFQGISSRKALIIRILSKQSLFLFSALGQTVLWILSTNSLFLEVQPRLRLAVNMEFKKLDSHI